MVVIAGSPIKIPEGQNSVTTEVKCEAMDLDMKFVVFELVINDTKVVINEKFADGTYEVTYQSIGNYTLRCYVMDQYAQGGTAVKEVEVTKGT